LKRYGSSLPKALLDSFPEFKGILSLVSHFFPGIFAHKAADEMFITKSRNKVKLCYFDSSLQVIMAKNYSCEGGNNVEEEEDTANQRLLGGY